MTQMQQPPWLRGLQGLLGGGSQDAIRNNPGGFVDTGWWRANGLPSLGSARYNAPGQGAIAERSQRFEGQQGNPLAGLTYGGAMAGGLAHDWNAAEGARRQELDMLGRLLGSVGGSMQGAGQMVADARRAGESNMAALQPGLDAMERATRAGSRSFDEARRQMLGSLDEMRGRMDEGVGTMRQARSDYDAGRRDDAMAQSMGVQQQYQSQIQRIESDPSLTPEQRSMMKDDLHASMHRDGAALAAQADARARDTLLGIDQQIAQMQQLSGSAIGQAGIGVGQAIGQLGMGFSAQAQQTAAQQAQLMSQMSQFNASLLQSAQASAMQHVLNGNSLAASIVERMPFGPMSVFETIARMATAVDAGRGDQVSPLVSGLMGSVGGR